MEKIDKRRHYILVLDTETANTIQKADGLDMDNVLAYDVGWAVIDTHGTVYVTHSYVNNEIFVNERELMRTAYYAKKIPQYSKEIREGKRIMANTFTIRQKMLEDISTYGIKEVCAHNARFDWRSLDNTQRYCTKSAFRYWMPYGITWWDSLKMARSVICKMPTYRKYCEKNGYVCASGRLKATAEILYRFITKNDDFTEAHTGLEDVLIEAQIVAYCYRQHKKMERNLFKNKLEFPAATQFQRALLTSIKDNPVLNMGGV